MKSCLRFSKYIQMTGLARLAPDTSVSNHFFLRVSFLRILQLLIYYTEFLIYYSEIILGYNIRYVYYVYLGGFNSV